MGNYPKEGVEFRASPKRPCPVCGTGTKGCSVLKDGLHLCRGEPHAGWRRLSKTPDVAGFSCFRSEADYAERRAKDSKAVFGKRTARTNGSAKTATNGTTGGNNGTANGSPPKNWRAEAERCARNLTPELKHRLAKTLRLPVEAIDELPLVGHDPNDREGACWTFPERNPAGQIIGLLRRFEKPTADGKNKKAKLGSSRGIVFADGWRDRPGTIYIVEGPTDFLAMVGAGLACVARPSNNGGAEMLAELFRGLPREREIVVLGENDQKEPGGLWPGRDGMMTVGNALANTLKRPIQVALPPPEAKDARDFLTSDASALSTLPEMGETFARLLAERAETVGSDQDEGGDDLPLMYFEDIEANLDTADFVEALLIDGAMSVIYGDSNTGKTFWILNLALHVGGGMQWCGREVDRRGILYLALEGGHGIRNRIAAFKKAGANAADIAIAVVPVSVNLLDPAADTARVIKSAKRAARRLKVPVGLIVVDTLSRAIAGGNENASEDMGALVRNIDTIRQSLPSHVAVVHHSGKDGARRLSATPT